jgi:hypothetical protein
MKWRHLRTRLIVHEQISVPVDLRTGKAMLDLKP